jgi:hypothetical protein
VRTERNDWIQERVMGKECVSRERREEERMTKTRKDVVAEGRTEKRKDVEAEGMTKRRKEGRRKN